MSLKLVWIQWMYELWGKIDNISQYVPFRMPVWDLIPVMSQMLFYNTHIIENKIIARIVQPRVKIKLIIASQS